MTVAPVTSEPQLVKADCTLVHISQAALCTTTNAGASQRLLTIGWPRIITSNRRKGQERIDTHCLVCLIAAL